MIFFSTPKFWYRKDPGIFLRSMSEISGFIHGFFNKKEYKFNPSIKTIAIGGITVGGAGKTPVARYLGKILTEYLLPFLTESAIMDWIIGKYTIA